MVRGLSTDVTPATYSATVSCGTESVTLAIAHGERGAAITQSALQNAFALTTAAAEDLPVHNRLKRPIVELLQTGVARSVRHGTKEGAPALFVQVSYGKPCDIVRCLRMVSARWNNGPYSRLAITLPAVLTNRPQVIIQYAAQLFQNSVQRNVVINSPMDHPSFFNSTGMEMIELLGSKPGIGKIELSDASSFGLTNMTVGPADQHQPPHLLVNACVQVFTHFDLSLGFAN